MKLSLNLIIFFVFVINMTAYAAESSFPNRAISDDVNRSWIRDGRLTEEAYTLLTAIRADSSILCSKERYSLEQIDELLQKYFLSDKFESQLNRALNRAFSLYISDRRDGCLDPLEIYGEQIYIDDKVKQNGEEGDNILLQRLKYALKRYETVRANGGWKRVPQISGLLKMGDNSESVRLIRKRLFKSGDLNDSDFSNTFFDESLEDAVKLFQTRHSLKSDGIVGPMTLAAMNIPVERKISLIRINMERLRWLTAGNADFIVANIPEYTLTLFRDNSPELTMKTVVGRKNRPTPMLSDIMSYAVLNPYWRAPKTIVKEDILPKLKAGMFDYLRKIGIVVSRSMDGNESVDMESIEWRRYNCDDLPFIFMQKPGPQNYLGFVKFMFPNDLDIYIHDTPHSGLFEYKERTLSSGCIRVQKPVELFHALFGDEKKNEWSYKQIVREILKKEEKLVGLSKPIPVYILYLTVYSDEKQRVHFLPDIYGYDRKMESYLNDLAERRDSEKKSMHAGVF